MEYYKAVKFEEFIIFSSEFTEEELLKFEDGNFKYINGTDSNANIRYDGDKYYLYEWQKYTVVGYRGTYLKINDFEHIGYLGHRNTGTIYFKNFVGVSRFKNVIFNIESKKMSTIEIDKLISDIDKRIQNTVSLDFSVSGVSKAEFKKQQDAFKGYYVYHKLYFLLKNDKIFPFLKYILKKHNKKIVYSKRKEYIFKTSNISEESVIDLFSGENLFTRKKGANLFPSLNDIIPETINEYNNNISCDTHENQFIKFFIELCIRIITNFINDLICDKKGKQVTNIVLVEELKYFRLELQKILRTDFFDGISKISRINHSNTILTRQFGYKEIYKEYINLKQTPVNLFDTNSLIELYENKSVDKLYEYICLFSLVDSIETIYDQKPMIKIEINDSSLHTLALSEKNNHIIFLFEKTNELPESRLLFQHSFNKKNCGSYSVEFRPDFTWQIDDGNSYLNYHFDAKFRMNLNNGTSENDDIVKMHGYRDGIENTMGAVVLFPGQKKVIYSKERKDNFSGVGALPVHTNGLEDSQLATLLKSCLPKR